MLMGTNITEDAALSKDKSDKSAIHGPGRLSLAEARPTLL
ncbi:hypothetical protein SBA4_5890007 [Candidatus Sulfopaludibacter sp. SbA4]|nr:hypothetical protein SBA4_5890007 [Candidatus Sulfopaludibacter sp. SbA4]